MTQPLAQHITRNPRGRPPKRLVALADDWRAAARAELATVTAIRFPSPKYRDNPAAFCDEILGFAPWDAQTCVLEAVRDAVLGRGPKRIGVSSGHKTGKSVLASTIALWFYCSFEHARVVLTSTTSRQVDQILWREVRMRRARSGRCRACGPDGPRPCPHSALIDGEQGDLARTGLKSSDFREIVGFTAREAEGVAGISGPALLYIADEASGIPDEIFEAIEGNRAGGAILILLGNPTRNEGEFFEAFHAKKDLYATFRISSESTPNAVSGRDVIPGLAGRDWIEEKKREWGETSAQYKIRVKGEHALHEDGKIFSIHTIEQAEGRWHDTEAEGRLYIGLDPAGESGRGDEIAFAIRRGYKVIALRVFLGLNVEGHLVQLLALLNTHKLPREVPVVVMDREGSIGAELYGTLRNFADANPGAFELAAVRASDRAPRQPEVYDRMRDGLVANLEGWIRDGGALPEDTKLAAELHEFEWKPQASNGRLKATPKEIVRKNLGRSPDRFDAVCLSVWEPLSMRDDLPESVSARERDDEHSMGGMDPYAGARAWRR